MIQILSIVFKRPVNKFTYIQKITIYMYIYIIYTSKVILLIIFSFHMFYKTTEVSDLCVDRI